MISLYEVMTRLGFKNAPKPMFKNSLSQIGTKRLDVSKMNKIRSMNFKRSLMGRDPKRMPIAR
jgi:hypothetical protein